MPRAKTWGAKSTTAKQISAKVKAGTPTGGSKSTSVSNTGERSVSTHTTGATGAVRNSTNITVTPGQAGADGVANASIQSTPGIEYVRGSININPATGVTHPVGDHGDTIRSAFTQVEGHLAQARQQALGQVPAEYRDRVNSAFDNADTQVANHRKRLGY